MADFLRQNDLDSILKLPAQLALTVLMDACQELSARHNKEPIADETNEPVVFFQEEQCGEPSDYAEVDEHVLHWCCAALCVINMTNDVEFVLPCEKRAIQTVVNIIRTSRSAARPLGVVGKGLQSVWLYDLSPWRFVARA